MDSADISLLVETIAQPSHYSRAIHTSFPLPFPSSFPLTTSSTLVSILSSSGGQRTRVGRGKTH